ISSCPPQLVEECKNSECRSAAAPQTEVCGLSQPNSPDLPSSCMRSPLFQLAEISSSGSQVSVSEVKQCGQSALFQLAEYRDGQRELHCVFVDLEKVYDRVPREELWYCMRKSGVAEKYVRVVQDMYERSRTVVRCAVGQTEEFKVEVGLHQGSALSPFLFAMVMDQLSEEMCLASEAEKLEALSSQPAMDSSSLCAQDSAPNTTPTMDLPTPSPPSSPPTSSKKKKKKPNDVPKGEKSPGSPKKPCKKRSSSSSDLESLMYTIEAVAKGAWGSEEMEPTKKRARPSGSPTVQPSTAEKKKTKPKAKKQLRTKEEEEEKEEGEDCKPLETEESPISHEAEIKTECKKEADIKLDREENSEPHVSTAQQSKSVEPDSPLPNKGEERDLEVKPVVIQTEEKEVEPKPEACGSRKSERSCKGALYKTLVSEGMLTSLRANVDRGKRGSMRGTVSESEIGWTDESCNFSQPAASNPKKLKKSKSKDEPVLGNLGKLEEEFEKKFNSLPQYSPLTFDKKSTAVTKRKKANVANPLENPMSNKSPSPSQKKTLFHKIVSKYKHKKEKAGTLDKAIAQPDPAASDTGTVKADSSSVSLPTETRKMGDVPVGSQKRKARKSKITHLVRTADGRLSPAEADKVKELTQDQDGKPLTHETLCNTESCSTDPGPAESDSLPAFFSLAALAEVAAMENMHRGQRAVTMAAEGQVKDMAPQTPVLISCADQ
ncbi:hypothetical protein QTP86_019183, partial [Hemibagrus guttatus]